jgi:hypothetical protein
MRPFSNRELNEGNNSYSLVKEVSMKNLIDAVILLIIKV